jgi:hypothetical protein
MSDDQERRRDDATSEEAGEDRPDAGSVARDAAEATPGDATSPLSAVDGTAAHTRHFDPVSSTWDDDDTAWSGRARVRPPRPGQGDDRAGADWAGNDWADETGDRWWMPIVVGTVALLLLALLIWGMYLIIKATGDDVPEPTPAVTASAAPAVPATEPAPASSAPPEPPRRSAAPSPTDITVPALKGLSVQDARAALDRTGLYYRLRFVKSDSPAGTVIDSDPAEGQQVPADTVITLIIAAESRPSASAPSATTEPAGGPDQGGGN